MKILEIYKVDKKLIKFLEKIMEKWRTTLNLKTPERTYTTDKITIRKGIYQGDTLSPLWFCMALNPLTDLLNDMEKG